MDAPSLRVIRERGPDRRVRVRVDEDSTATIEELGRVLAKEMLRRVFPMAGTALERVPNRPKAAVIVAVRGAYEYEELHLRVLRDWLNAASGRPRREVRFEYEGVETGLRVAWPLGIVVRDLARVYLLGVPSEAANANDVRTRALERVLSKRIDVLPLKDSGRPPKGIDSAPIEDSMDLPFSISPGERCPRARALHARAGEVHSRPEMAPESADQEAEGWVAGRAVRAGRRRRGTSVGRAVDNRTRACATSGIAALDWPAHSDTMARCGSRAVARSARTAMSMNG